MRRVNQAFLGFTSRETYEVRYSVGFGEVTSVLVGSRVLSIILFRPMWKPPHLLQRNVARQYPARAEPVAWIQSSRAMR